LVVPLLANIYRGLRGLASSHDPPGCGELIPYHFICGWLHMHFMGLYQGAALSEPMRRELPLLADIAGTTATSFSAVGARHVFHRCSEHLRPARARLSTLYSGRLTDRVIIDEIPLPGSGGGIRERLDDWEYLVSIRYGFLPLRLRDHAVIEPYSPHRCSHQFSLDQDIPLMLRRPSYLAVDLLGLGWCYAFLFRTGTGSRCQMASLSRTYMFSQSYQQWYWALITAYQSITPATLVRDVCVGYNGKRKNIVSQSSIPESAIRDTDLFPAIRGEPLDFQGLDSRFSFTPFRSFIAGIFLFYLLTTLFFFHMMSLMTIDHISSFEGPSGSAGPSHPSQFARREDIPVQPSSEHFSSPARPVPMTGILYSFSIFLLVIISQFLRFLEISFDFFFFLLGDIPVDHRDSPVRIPSPLTAIGILYHPIF
jgi:hypothetical protein